MRPLLLPDVHYPFHWAVIISYVCLYYASMIWVLVFCLLPSPLGSDWEPPGKDILLFIFDLVGGHRHCWNPRDWTEGFITEWTNESKDLNGKRPKIIILKGTTNTLYRRHPFLFKNIFTYIPEIKMHWKINWYWIVWLSLFTNVSSGIESHCFPLDKQNSLVCTLVVSLTDEQESVKAVESKVNKNPPRIIAYCSCPSLKQSIKVFQMLNFLVAAATSG